MKFTRFSFGGTASIITSLGLIIGLLHTENAKSVIISGLLVIGVADNISDSLGLHIYQESENLDRKETLLSPIINFLARMIVVGTFITIISILPLEQAEIVSIIWGLILLSAISYMISKHRKINPVRAILEHLVVVVFVVILSSFLGDWIANKF